MLRTRMMILFALLVLVSFSAPRAEADESSMEAQLDYGDAWAELGNWRRALKHYRQAQRKNPKQLSVKIRVIRALSRLGRPVQARKLIQSVQIDKISNPLWAAELGTLWLQLKNAKQSCRYYDHAAQLDSDLPRAIYGRARCRQELFSRSGDQEFKSRSVHFFRSYLKRYPGHIRAHSAREALDELSLGKAGRQLADARKAFAQGDFKRSEKLLRQITKNTKDAELAHYLLGQVLINTNPGNAAEARKQWQLAPSLAPAWWQRGLLAFEQDDSIEAQKLCQRAVQIDPAFAPAYYTLGMIGQELASYPDSAQQQHIAGAKIAFQKVTELVPQTALAQRATAKLQVLDGELPDLAEGEILDPAAEIKLGQILADRIEKRLGLVEDIQLQTRLQKILQRLLAHAELQPGSRPYRVRVLKVDGINALGLAGGTIFLYQGLVRFIQREMGDKDDVLAAVIAHELVHVTRRHGVEALRLKGGLNMLAPEREIDVRRLRQLQDGIHRRNEYEADQLGCLYAYRAGYDPTAAYRFHRQMTARGHEIPDSSEHPSHHLRAERMKEYLLGLRRRSRNFDLGLEELSQSHFELARRHLEIYLGLFPGSLAARNNLGVALFRQALQKNHKNHPYKLSNDIDPRRCARPIRFRSAGDESKQRFVAQRLLMLEAAEIFRSVNQQEPKYAPAVTNLAAAWLVLDQSERAQAQFKRAIELQPNSAAASSNLAVAKLLSGDTQSGISLLQQVIHDHPDFADARYNLGRALQEQGKKTEALAAYRAYLLQDPQSGWAQAARGWMAQLDQ